MARDHPKKASSSSKHESNNNESLSTRKSETVCHHRPTNAPSELPTSSTSPVRKLIKMQPKLPASSTLPEKMNGESWYRCEYMVRKSLAKAKDSNVRVYKAVEKDASNILRACFPSECRMMRERIKEMFGKSPHSEISKLRREYEEKVTAPIKESIETFSFHTTMNYLNMGMFMKVRFALICFVSYLWVFMLLSISHVKPPYCNRNARNAGFFAEFVI